MEGSRFGKNKDLDLGDSESYPTAPMDLDPEH